MNGHEPVLQYTVQCVAMYMNTYMYVVQQFHVSETIDPLQSVLVPIISLSMPYN